MSSEIIYSIVLLDKGVSDSETCVDYLALPGRLCENLNFPAHFVLNYMLLRKIYQPPKKDLG